MTDPTLLTTLCFDLPDAVRPGDGHAEMIRIFGTAENIRDRFPTRLYEGLEVQPRYMAWHEGGTEAPAALPVASLEIMRFTLARDVGQTASSDNPWLYIVHTDIPDHIIDEYNAWYDEEHLPRLVQVPGVIRARRYVAMAAAPRYLTAYELTDPRAFESPEGLTARKTPWTEKMRSLFHNTRRRMYRLMPPSP